MSTSPSPSTSTPANPIWRRSHKNGACHSIITTTRNAAIIVNRSAPATRGCDQTKMGRSDHVSIPVYSSDVAWPLHAGAGELRAAADAGHLAGAGPGARSGHGPSVVLSSSGSDRGECLRGSTDNLCQRRSGWRHAARDVLLSRFPAGKVPVYGTALRNSHTRTRHVAARAGNAGLCTGTMGAQLGSRPYRRG